MNAWRSGEVLKTPMNPSSQELYQTYLEQGLSPVEPRYAATVMLVRAPQADVRPEAREVFMLRRVKTMKFVPDAVVFPGGGVDARDVDERLPWNGPSPATWALRMGTDEDTARRVVVAAAREVFEECGVLLAGEDSGVVRDVASDQWREERERLAHHELSFAELLIRHNLTLRSDLLGLRSHWLTPEYEPRRYDTYFFAALVPEGQTPDDLTSETNRAEWANAVRILKGGDTGKVRLMPPTAYNLTHYLNAPSVESFVCGVEHVKRIMLRPTPSESEGMILSCLLP